MKWHKNIPVKTDFFFFNLLWKLAKNRDITAFGGVIFRVSLEYGCSFSESKLLSVRILTWCVGTTKKRQPLQE